MNMTDCSWYIAALVAIIELAAYFVRRWQLLRLMHERQQQQRLIDEWHSRVANDQT